MNHARQQQVTVDDIRRGLRDGEFFYCYQPKTNFETGALVGAEALMRWRHGDRIVPPGEFIPLAEREGLGPELFSGMIPHAVEDAKRLKSVGIDIPISINMSSDDLMVSDTHELLYQLCLENDMDGRDFQVEITESIVLNEDTRIRQSIKRLLDYGIKLLMDDFGTGYSSIDVLSKFPFSYVKLDMGLISRMAGSLKNYRIVKGIVHLSHDLNIDTVAEGVESRGDYLTLQMLGCTEAQGYYISRPLPLNDFIDFAHNADLLPGTQISTLFNLQSSLSTYRKSIVSTVMCQYGSPADDRDPSAFEQEIEHDPENCRFGRWYYGQGQKLAYLPAFVAIEIPHRKMRELGLEIIRAVYRRGIDFSEVVRKIQGLNAYSAQVDRLMSNLIEAYLVREKANAGALPPPKPVQRSESPTPIS